MRNPALRAELLQRSGQSTLPQIFVGDESVGSYRELTLMLSNDALRSCSKGTNFQGSKDIR